MAKLCFDYGHGGSDPGACYNGRKESVDVLNIGREVAAEVRRHGVFVDETRTSDATVSLQERSDFENQQSYDFFLSFHRNAFSPEKAAGVEIYTCLKPGAKSRSLAGRIQTALVDLGFANRGLKQANYHVLRETKAPAVLVEMGFIDNTQDNNLFDSKRNEIIKALAKAILTELGVNYVEPFSSPQPADGATYYRVMAGSFSVKENAEKQVQKLKEAGFDATIMAFSKQ